MFKCTFGHKWSDWTYEAVNQCQCVRNCQRCGKEETKVIHNLSEWKYLAPDSYFQEQICQRCSHRNTRTHEVSSPYQVGSKKAYQHADSLKEKAYEQRNSGNYGEARHLFKQALISDPENVFIRNSWGQMELGLRNFDTAIFLFKESTNIRSYHGASWRNWGIAEKRLGNYDEARSLFEKSASSVHQNSQTWQVWAKLEKEQGYFNKARRFFRQSVSVNPKNFRAWHSWSMMEKDLGDIDEARRLFDTAVLTNPQNTAAYQTWALMEMEQGNPDKALELIQKALEMNDEEWHVLIASGEIQKELGNDEIARSEFAKAEQLIKDWLQKKPNDFRALNLLGRVLVDLEKYDHAKDILQQSVEASSLYEKHYGLNGLGEIYWAQGNSSEAMQEWKKALEFAPYYLAVRNNLQRAAEQNNIKLEPFQIRKDDVVDNKLEDLIEQITAESKAPYIKKIFEERKYGFIRQPTERDDLYFRFEYVENKNAIQTGARVKYNIVETTKGNEARDVVIL